VKIAAVIATSKNIKPKTTFAKMEDIVVTNAEAFKLSQPGYTPMLAEK
jgi:hypothetical protein